MRPILSVFSCLLVCGFMSCQTNEKEATSEDVKIDITKQLQKESMAIEILKSKYPDNYIYFHENGLVKHIKLLNHKMDSFPPEIRRFSQLEYLMVKNAGLKALPDWIVELNMLKQLLLSENRFESLPPIINLCKSLTTIGLSETPLKSFRLDSVLPHLEMIGLSECPLISFPVIPQVNGSPSIYLDLRETSLKSIPKEIGNMKIKELLINDNQLEYIAPEIGMLKDLEKLDLSGSPKLNAQFPETIGKCTNLEDLKLNWCGLQEFPAFISNLENLVYLHLENNLLKEIPSEIGNLKKLEYFRMKENKLSTLPKELNQLPRLRYLGLEYNNISEFPTEMFDIKRDTLCVLVLDGNPVRGIPVSEEQFHKGYKHFGEKQ